MIIQKNRLVDYQLIIILAELPTWGQWDMCSNTCEGTRSRSRDCSTADSDDCDGGPVELENCNTWAPEDLTNLAHWSHWSRGACPTRK